MNPKQPFFLALDPDEAFAAQVAEAKRKIQAWRGCSATSPIRRT